MLHVNHICDSWNSQYLLYLVCSTTATCFHLLDQGHCTNARCCEEILYVVSFLLKVAKNGNGSNVVVTLILCSFNTIPINFWTFDWHIHSNHSVAYCLPHYWTCLFACSTFQILWTELYYARIFSFLCNETLVFDWYSYLYLLFLWLYNSAITRRCSSVFEVLFYYETL